MRARNLQHVGEVLRNVGPFIIEDRLLDNLRTGRAQSRLCEIREHAVRERWKRILVFSGRHDPRIRDEDTGEIRFAYTSDEDEDGILPVHLNYPNPLWKLQLSRGPHFPLNTVCDFLGMSQSDTSSSPGDTTSSQNSANGDANGDGAIVVAADDANGDGAAAQPPWALADDVRRLGGEVQALRQTMRRLILDLELGRRGRHQPRGGARVRRSSWP